MSAEKQNRSGHSDRPGATSEKSASSEPGHGGRRASWASGAGSRPAPRKSPLNYTPPFAAGLASLFTLSFALLVRDAAGAPGPGIATSLLVILAPLVYQAVAERFQETTSGTAARYRALFVAMLIAYTVLSLVRAGPLLERFIPDALLIWRMVLVFVAWAISAELFRSVRDRRTLLRAVYREREGPARERVLKELSEVTADAMDRLTAERRLTTVLLILLVLAALLGWLTGGAPSNTAFALIAGFAILRYLTVATYDSFLDEYRYIGDGNRLPARYRRRRLRHAAVLVVIAALFALPVSGNESLLPPEWIGQIIGAFSELFPALEMESEPPPPPEVPSTVEMFERFQADLGPEDEPRTPDWVIWFFTVLERLALAAVISALAIFLLSPLFTDEMRRKLRAGRIAEALRLWALTIFARLTWVFRVLAFILFRRRDRRSGHSAHDYTVRHSTRRPMPGTPLTVAQKRALEKAAKRFEKLERWARKHGVPRRESEPPAEFALRLASEYGNLSESFGEFAWYYEQAVFSNRGLSTAEWKALDSALKRILQAK